MTPRIKSLDTISSCLLLLLTASMAVAYGAGTAKLDPVDYIKPIIGTNGTKRCGRTISAWYVLNAMGVEDNTIVFLASDNGPTAVESCAGLRGKKSFTWEGGVRVPAIIRWPGTVRPGSQYSNPVAGIDVLPTLCDIVGADLPKKHIDGVNIRAVLEGKPFARTAPILTFFHRTSPAASMRLGDYVLIAQSDDETRKKSHAFTAPDMPKVKGTKLVSFELYNVKDDLGQNNDIASSYPETLATLRKTMVDLHRHALTEGAIWELPETKTSERKRNK